MKVEVPKERKKKTEIKSYIIILNMGEYQANARMDFLPKSLQRLSQLKPGQTKRTENTK